jgi:argininosuccinate lyase
MKRNRASRATARSSQPGLLRERFTRARLPAVEAFTASLPFDRRLYRHDIAGSIAHARMLAKVRLITRIEAARIVRGLRSIEREIASGRFHFDAGDEDIHIAIERRLIGKIGDAGRKLHTARSRNDQIALDLRLFLRDETRAVLRLIDQLMRALATVARRHVETVMPGYTHLQRAQPVTLAHHALAYLEMLIRDRERFAQALDRLDVMPLGAGALAGTTLPIDRRAVAQELGFRRVSENSIDAVSDRDFAADFIFAAALTMVHLSRMCEELILWTSAEFGFAMLPDEFATGSSMMPQKKNPDLLELIRGKTGRVAGDLVALLTTLKGLPLAYNSDLQEDKEPVFDALDTLKPSLGLLARLWPRIKFDAQRMRAAAGGYALATDLAEYLVRRGVAFREAHGIVGRLVRDAVAAGKPLERLALAELRRYSSKFGADARILLMPERSVARRRIIGGPAPATVRDRLRRLGLK